MSRPRVYVHRVGASYSNYMDAESEALLASFADVTNHGREVHPLPAPVVSEALRGVTGILSINGAGAGDLTAAVLREAGTVRVAVVGHWFHNSHNRLAPLWREAGVEVIDASDGNNEAVAEWAIGAAIAGLRRFEHFDRQMKAGVLWPEKRGVARQLSGSTFGIVGLGRVGRLVAKFLRPFDTRVLGFDRYVDRETAASFGVQLVDLQTLLKTADVVSLHLPNIPETAGIIGAMELSLLKDGALFLNCARAPLVDGRALRTELTSGRLRAYLDVFEEEPLPADDVLRTLDTVVLTPHVAGATAMMFRRCGRKAVEAMQAFLAAAPGRPAEIGDTERS